LYAIYIPTAAADSATTVKDNNDLEEDAGGIVSQGPDESIGADMTNAATDSSTNEVGEATVSTAIPEITYQSPTMSKEVPVIEPAATDDGLSMSIEGPGGGQSASDQMDMEVEEIANSTNTALESEATLD
jgi:hypothetical protein